ncbi:DUF3857 and transglutaminase domain-containing protein [Roseivirga sp.]|uniref:DUF3857 and transglutaminase domain-containing protein n=1 Tax=Roseivirga sp. TaxID=1964215 RepID=UPI003B52FF96
MKSVKLTLITFIFLLPFFTRAQVDIKYGDIEPEDFEIISFNGDSSVSAIVLADIGFSEIQYDPNNGWYLYFERHKRVKVINTEGFDQADISIPLYESNGSSEKLGSFKAATYNLDGKKVNETKVKKRDGFEEKVNENWSQMKFTMPDVKAGSIIEYTYDVRSDFLFNLQDWTFQNSIPTLWSEYRVLVPEYFIYQRIMQGFHPFILNEEGTTSGTITIMDRTRTGSSSRGVTTAGRTTTNRYDYMKYVNHWGAENIPAFKPEPYMSSVGNYISKVEFELASTKDGDGSITKYMGTWDEINKTMLENQDFGGRLSGNGFLNDIVANATAGKSSQMEKVQAIFDYVRSNVEWNGYYRRYADESFRNVLDKGTGSSAEINLLLINMLRKAEIEANPVLLSTRNNGFIKKDFAISSQFNYVLAEVVVDGETMLIDATSRSLPMELLPTRDLNVEGLRVSATNPGWVELSTKGTYTTIISAALDLDESGSISGEVSARYMGYSAANMRSDFNDEDEDFKETVEEDYEWTIDSLSVEGEKEAADPFYVTYQMETQKGVEALGDLMYVNPFVLGRVDENPFKLETREFPVDFIASQRFTYSMTLNIPEGYVVDELPEQAAMALPGNAGIFRYLIQNQGESIMIRCQLNLMKPLFTSIDYPALREFYNQVVQKEAEQIVLKKKTDE